MLFTGREVRIGRYLPIFMTEGKYLPIRGPSKAGK